MNNDICVDIMELTSVLQIPESRISSLIKKGMPKYEAQDFPLMACIKWYIKYLHKQTASSGEEMLTAKLREARAKASKAEIENAKAQSKVIDAESLKQQFIFLLQKFKEEREALPSRICESLANQSAEDIRMRLEVELTTSLNRLVESINNHVIKPNNIGSGNISLEDQGI